MKPRFTQIVAVHLFLLKNDCILLARRCNTGFADGQYSVPAGHVEKNESATEAMIREAAEEIAIQLRPEDLSLAHVMHRRSDSHRIDFFFACTNWTGEPIISEPEKCDDLRWTPVDALPEKTVPYIRQAVEKFRHHQPYSELGFS